MMTYMFRLLWRFTAGVLVTSPAWGDDLHKDQIPAPVLHHFREDFPKARRIEYELETEDGHRVYEIDFKVGRRNIQAHYREDGTLIRQDIQKSDDDD